MSVSFEYELKAIRAKLARLLDIYASFSHIQPPMNEWPFWMEKLNALASQYHGLQKELTQALESAVIEPSSVKGSPDHIPNVLLRSKMMPEVESACETKSTASPLASSAQLAAANQLLHEFSGLREAFEADMRAWTVKDKTTETSTLPELEATIRLMYVGRSA